MSKYTAYREPVSVTYMTEFNSNGHKEADKLHSCNTILIEFGTGNNITHERKQNSDYIERKYLRSIASSRRLYRELF